METEQTGNENLTLTQMRAPVWVAEIDARSIAVGGMYNLVDDSNPNHRRLVCQFRVEAAAASGDRKVCVLAQLDTAVVSQIESVSLSRTSQPMPNIITTNFGIIGIPTEKCHEEYRKILEDRNMVD